MQRAEVMFSDRRFVKVKLPSAGTFRRGNRWTNYGPGARRIGEDRLPCCSTSVPAWAGHPYFYYTTIGTIFAQLYRGGSYEE